ncbi:cation diffusion facilitator family transporter [Bombilactobacillus bombi]|uniref:cation diffusion facilitator family transporter n=1 Tax=Bombilactobacillus bombi TaxID=1303590 RepID=UPI0015E59CAD|nr:cation diffusion facilitator family transporter [Bombilactobacillus bombi]MBA1434159.1 cation transporter [Bombilactobacillus bombi]
MKDQHSTTNLSDSKFALVTALNAAITIVEFVGGIISGSLGLISDGFHNMEDTLSVVLSFIAHIISKKNSNERQTFGYQRAEILAAFVNSAILIAITLILIFEGIKRLGHPQLVNGGIMLLVSIVGVAANLLSMLVMQNAAHHNLNIKATFLHMAADTLSSLGVLVAAVLINMFNWTWVDPLLTLITAAWIMKESFEVIKQTVSILMEASPDIELEQVQKTLLQLPEIVNVHHVHLWRIDENLIAFDAHINVRSTETMAQLESLYQKIEKLLSQQFGINHVTIQAECQRGIHEHLVYQHQANKK